MANSITDKQKMEIMNELLQQIACKANQHRRTTQLMFFVGFFYAAYTLLYLLLTSLGLLGNYAEILGFAAVCIYLSITYWVCTGGLKRYKRHLQITEKCERLCKKAIDHKRVKDIELLVSYHSIIANSDVKPTIGGRFLACIWQSDNELA